MTWAVKRTDTFLDSLKAIRKNKEALAELDTKIKRLQVDPCISVAGFQERCMVRNRHEYQKSID
jgi:hypothetical protein